MGVAMFGPVTNMVPFRLDPTSISWEYQVNSTWLKTIGGKVVQIYGASVSNMTVEGTFGVGGWQEQQLFLAQVKKWSDAQMQTATTTAGANVTTGTPASTDAWYRASNIPGPGGFPLVFSYPGMSSGDLAWNFAVYLLDFSQPGETTSALYRRDIIAPQWALKLFIVNAFGQDSNTLAPVTDAAIQSYLDALTAGVGWEYNKFNLPGGNLPPGVPVNANAQQPAAPAPPPQNPPPSTNNQGQTPQQSAVKKALGSIPIFGGSPTGGLGGPVNSPTTPSNNPENPASPNFGT